MEEKKTQEGPATLPNEELLNAVIGHREAFLRFLMSRLESPVIAGDVLQTAYLKALQHGSDLRHNEISIAWFYRILRNSVADHYRRRAAHAKALEAIAAETPDTYEQELHNTVCACVCEVVADLKPEYRSAIERVDLAGVPVEEFARSEQISANNASVRLHRARRAMTKHLMTVCGACAEHKCFDCTCHRSQV
jgi:RNA polymerase sigma factor (sigma-70 family)